MAGGCWRARSEIAGQGHEEDVEALAQWQEAETLCPVTLHASFLVQSVPLHFYLIILPNSQTCKQQADSRSSFKEGYSSHPVRAGREASNPWALPHYLEHREEQLFQLTLVFKVSSS